MKTDKLIMFIILIIITIIFGILLLIGDKKEEKNIDPSYDFNIYFFNAGKADAILLSKNNHYIMIDTGEESLNNEILSYFKNNNITKLDYLIITHFDKDHVGSASSIIDNIEIGEVLQSNYPKESEYYNNYLNSLDKKGIIPKTISNDYNITLDDINIVVNGPTTIYDKNESNNSSLIVKVTYKNNKFLFMGDSENARIKDFLSTNNETYDFIKIPYHGNYLKRLDNLLKSTNSKYGVMTCSKLEGCEQETLEVLNNYSIKYYMTKNGSINVLSDGTNIKIEQ